MYFLRFIRNLFKKRYNVPIVLVHGGAGHILQEAISQHKKGVKLAACAGFATLLKTKSVLDAVHQAVCALEQDTQFNAGFGSVLNYEGKVEMDAAIMDGATLNAGCVSLVRDIQSPITLARYVMEKTRHKYLAGEGVMIFAKQQGFEILHEGALITPNALEELKIFKERVSAPKEESNCNSLIATGTVGAVAIDTYGNVAAATSTGGINGKMPGRIGDSPILGAGTYADNDVGCVSVTGPGETIMRYNVASRILALIKHRGLTASKASSIVLNDMQKRFNRNAGVISLDRYGGLGFYFTTPHMPWAYYNGTALHCGVVKGEDEVESDT